MSEYKQHMNTLWYTRRGETVRGPFPVGLIRRYVLLGRMHADDEVSQNGQNWRPLSRVAELMPPELGEVGSIRDLEHMQLIRRHADERGSHDRRDHGEKQENERRMRVERRKAEARSELVHRELHDKTFLHAHHGLLHYLPRIVGLLVVVGLVIGLFAFLGQEESVQQVDCNAPAVAGVNWSNCRLEGVQGAEVDLSGAQLRNVVMVGGDLQRAKLNQADLSYADLAFVNLQGSELRQAKLLGANLQNSNLRAADLRGSDLSYADLRFADLTGVTLDGARLGKTIWTDGRICAPESVGSCQ